METKRGESRTAASESAAQRFKKLGNFFGDIKAEFGKITWPSKEELQSYTKIVVVSTFVFGLAVYVVDVAIQNLLSLIETALRFIIG